MRKAVSIIIYGLLMAIVYLVYTGVFSLVEIILSIAIGLIVAYIFAGDIITYPSKFSLSRIYHAIAYLIKYFTVIEARAHWSVMKIILSRNTSLKPAIVRVPFKANNPYTIVFVANSITNTPGTVVVDMDENKKAYYVHWLTPTSLTDDDAYRNISLEFEKHLTKVFE